MSDGKGRGKGWKGTIEERFWRKVRKTRSCWVWTAANDGRYGIFFPSRKEGVKAHRFSWILHYGEIPYRATKDRDWETDSVPTVVGR